MIVVQNLTKRFGKFIAVNDVNFEVKPGEAVALWGPNGAGKTTIIRCILGLLRYKGAISVQDCDVKRRGKLARKLIGYVPQELAFYDDFRANEALAFFARLKRVPRQRIDIVLDEVGLLEHKTKRVRELSGGMKQRLALASALLANPPLLLLDELTSNLDAEAQAGFMTLLSQLKSKGKTILYTSHRHDEIEDLSDRVLILHNGKLVRESKSDEVRPANRQLSILKLYIMNRSPEEAVTTLKDQGFIAARNGCSIHVAVKQNEKARPICTLRDADFEISNFDLTDTDSLGLLLGDTANE